MYPSILLNECLQRFIPICMAREMNQKRLQSFLGAPYLTYESHAADSGFTKEEADALQLLADDGIVRVPFPIFRFCVNSDNGDKFCGVVERSPNLLYCLCFCRPRASMGPLFYQVFAENKPDVGVICHGVIWNGDKKLNVTALDVSNKVNDGDDDPSYLWAQKMTEEHPNLNGISRQDLNRMEKALNLRRERLVKAKTSVEAYLQSHEIFKKEKESVIKPLAKTYSEVIQDDASYIFYEVIKVICYEYLAPHNFMAVVRPNGFGRSVEWLKAREHITLIHRHHDANNSTLGEGGLVDADHAKTVKRCAHSRRAHVKVLRSPRFKYKQGQRIFVKASWVGPKQWKDTAGQTYQILIPVSRPSPPSE